jgi:hypothetical protein
MADSATAELTFTVFLVGHRCVENKSACPALTRAVGVDPDTVFVRRIKKSNQSAHDYQNKDEMGRTYDRAVGDCEDLSTWRGISIRPWVDVAELQAHYIAARRIAPDAITGGTYLQRIRFRVTAGKIRHTAARKDARHHDLYKSDAFSYSDVVPVGTPTKAERIFKGLPWAI